MGFDKKFINFWLTSIIHLIMKGNLYEKNHGFYRRISVFGFYGIE